MPELPEVEAVRRELEPVVRGARIADVVLHRNGLRRLFPATLREDLVGRTILGLDRRGKYLLAPLSSDPVLSQVAQEVEESTIRMIDAAR